MDKGSWKPTAGVMFKFNPKDKTIQDNIGESNNTKYILSHNVDNLQPQLKSQGKSAYHLM